MKTTEQNILNYLDVGIKVAANLVAANNPAYAGIIAIIGALTDHANSVVNPGAPAAAAQIATAASNLTDAAQTVIPAVEAAVAPAATPATKASVIGTLLGEIATVAGSVISVFERAPDEPVSAAPVVQAAPPPPVSAVTVH